MENEEGQAYLLEDVSSGNCADDDGDVDSGTWHICMVADTEMLVRGSGDFIRQMETSWETRVFVTPYHYAPSLSPSCSNRGRVLT